MEPTGIELSGINSPADAYNWASLTDAQALVLLETLGQPINFRGVAAIPATTYATTVDSIRTPGVNDEGPTPWSATLIGRAHSFYKA